MMDLGKDISVDLLMDRVVEPCLMMALEMVVVCSLEMQRNPEVDYQDFYHAPVKVIQVQHVHDLVEIILFHDLVKICLELHHDLVKIRLELLDHDLVKIRLEFLDHDLVKICLDLLDLVKIHLELLGHDLVKIDQVFLGHELVESVAI
jgi:hypothetical protein